MTPPNEHTSEGGRDDRSRGPVPCGIDPIRCSSARKGRKTETGVLLAVPLRTRTLPLQIKKRRPCARPQTSQAAAGARTLGQTTAGTHACICLRRRCSHRQRLPCLPADAASSGPFSSQSFRCQPGVPTAAPAQTLGHAAQSATCLPTPAPSARLRRDCTHTALGPIHDRVHGHLRCRPHPRRHLRRHPRRRRRPRLRRHRRLHRPAAPLEAAGRPRATAQPFTWSTGKRASSYTLSFKPASAHGLTTTPRHCFAPSLLAGYPSVCTTRSLPTGPARSASRLRQ